MTDQLPTTVQVRHKYATVLDDTQGWRYSEEWAADFDRWLAERTAAAVQAERERSKFATDTLRSYAEARSKSTSEAVRLTAEGVLLVLQILDRGGHR